MKINDLRVEESHDRVMMSNTWRVKIVAAGDELLEPAKRMRQLLDRMDKQYGDLNYFS